jgi:hypothetical protein
VLGAGDATVRGYLQASGTTVVPGTDFFVVPLATATAESVFSHTGSAVALYPTTPCSILARDLRYGLLVRHRFCHTSLLTLVSANPGVTLSCWNSRVCLSCSSPRQASVSSLGRDASLGKGCV